MKLMLKLENYKEFLMIRKSNKKIYKKKLKNVKLNQKEHKNLQKD